MLNRTCNDFIDVLASKEPVPGGGGAAAYAGALGVALGSMVGNLTVGKKKYKDVEEEIIALLDKASEMTDQFRKLVGEDAEAFRPLSDAYRLPSGTEEEKAYKNEMIQKSLEGAAMVPLRIAELSAEAVKLHMEFAQKGSRLAVSDAGCGASMCRAALMSARLNVMINLKLMEDAELRDRLQKRLDEATSKGLALADEVYEYVENNL